MIRSFSSTQTKRFVPILLSKDRKSILIFLLEEKTPEIATIFQMQSYLIWTPILFHLKYLPSYTPFYPVLVLSVVRLGFR